MSSHAVHESERQAGTRPACDVASTGGNARDAPGLRIRQRHEAAKEARAARERAPSPLLSPFVAAVVLGGAAIVLLGAADGFGGRPLLGLSLVAAAAVAALFPVRFPGRRFDVNTSHPFVFCAMAACGPFAGTLADAAGVLATALGRGRRPAPRHLLFNLGLVAISTAAAWQAWVASGGNAASGLLPGIFSMLAAGTAYYVTNVALLGITISLEKRRPLPVVVGGAVAPTAMPFFGGVLIASVMLPSVVRAPGLAIGLGIATCAALVGMLRVLSRDAEAC